MGSIRRAAVAGLGAGSKKREAKRISVVEWCVPVRSLLERSSWETYDVRLLEEHGSPSFDLRESEGRCKESSLFEEGGGKGRGQSRLDDSSTSRMRYDADLVLVSVTYGTENMK